MVLSVRKGLKSPELFKNYSFLALLLFSATQLRAETDTIFVGNSMNHIGKHIFLFDDTTGIMSFETIRNCNLFGKSESNVPNLGISESVHWCRFTLKNTSTEEALFLDVEQPTLDEVSLYIPRDSSSYDSIPLSDSIAPRLRSFRHQNYVFRLDLKFNQSRTYFLRVVSGDQVQLPISIGSRDQIGDKHNKGDIFFGIYSGILLAMLLYNLFIYFHTREKTYLSYVIYICILYLTQANIQGYTLRLFLYQIPYLERYAVFVLSASVPVAAIIFMISFLRLKYYLPKSLPFLYIVISAYCVALTLAVLDYFQLSYQIMQVSAGSLALYQFGIAIYLSVRKIPQALNYLIAWSAFLVGIVIFVLKDFEIVPYNAFTYNMMSIGSAVESILLSFALADRINQLKKEKEASQAEALKVLQENKEIVEQHNATLEFKVHHRTSELERANLELNQTMRNLKLAQNQLLESEKLASLGQMTAGIAHELNNPINFMSSNVNPLRRDVQDLISLLDDYSQLNGDPDVHQQILAIKQRQKDLQIDQVKKEIDTLLNGIGEGAKRTTEIVRGLRVFARTDKDTLVKANINECINSTLIIMKSAMRGEVVVNKKLDENLPDINCYPGKLTQVFLNLFSNALHATRGNLEKGKAAIIEIKTWQEDDHLKVAIIDNGAGMTPEEKRRIFEPFYTTKVVGEGTGLGLSIVSGIISEHSGSVEVHSEPGGGSQFIVTLPTHLV